MKVGEYVRTKDGHIEKIIDKYKATYGYKIVVNEDFKFKHYEHNYIKHIIKSSPNIIDLIEVGDYVNGEKVGITIDTKELAIRNTGLIYDKPYNLIKNIDIKSIVTKEQFKSMEYKYE